MKKLLALLLSLVMVFGVMVSLASCKDEPPKVDIIGPGETDGDDDTKDYAWTAADNKEINMRLSLYQISFTNLAKRYITGEDETATAKVDEMIATRNENAQSTTMVKPNYMYWEPSESDWGHTDDKILEDVSTFDETKPDVYVTAFYDCIWATFSDGLANVARKTRTTDDFSDDNYFTFLESDYNAEEDDLGYNYQLMRSLAVIPDKAMFMVASDYTIDVFRAVCAMPVSITLLEGISAQSAVSKQANLADINTDGDDKFSIEELVNFVRAGKWTWDVMASLCSVVYEAGSEDTAESFGASKFGFYMDIWGGSSANAIGFSTPFAHFTKTVDSNGVPTYTQIDDTANFDKLSAALENLWTVQGAARVTNGDDASGAASYGGALGVADWTELPRDVWTSLADAAICEKFGRNEVLFMNITMIGCIEYDWLQDMDGFFGVVPLPLVEAGDENTDYVSSLGSGARVVAINVKTDDFGPVTAFLDYQSTHSSDILKAYFRSQQYEATNGEPYNVYMLQYLRDILVDQEAHALFIYTKRYLESGNDTNFTEEEKNEYFYGGDNSGRTAADYDFSKTGSYAGILDAFKYSDTTTEEMPKYFNQQYINTINVMYKVVVDKYCEVALDKNI